MLRASIQAIPDTTHRPRSEELLARSRRSLAGGESSTMRVLPYHPPFVVDRGEGCRIRDVDGHEYFDLNMAYGPLLFGHRPPFLVEALHHQVSTRGSQLGFPQELNFRVAEKVQELFPTVELLRFANSGTEAIASAIRVARAKTGRPGLVVFEGNYHGWSDAVFHKYHAPLEELPDEPGAPVLAGTLGMNGAPHNVYAARWGDLDFLDRIFARHRGQIAAVILEPVMGNAGVIPPPAGFLEGLRERVHAEGALLVFDEVITGLRIAAGGAQERYGVPADLTILSKALGCGVPVAAFGGSRELMQGVAEGRIFHGGVYSGNALVLSAADAVLSRILELGDSLYETLESRGAQLAAGLGEIFGRHSIPHVVQHVGPMLGLFLTHDRWEALESYRDVRRHCHFERFIALQHALLDRGVYIHPNQFEPMYLSAAHTREDIDEILGRFDDAVTGCPI